MKNKSYQIISLSMILIAIVMLGTAIYIISNKEDKKDYASTDADPKALKIEDNSSESKSSGDSKVSLDYKNKIIVDLKKKKVELFFQNPSRSNQDVVLEIMASSTDKDDEYITISKSGYIPVGYGIYELSLLDGVNLTKGDYSGRVVVSSYDKKTQEKAAVDTNIPVLIQVK